MSVVLGRPKRGFPNGHEPVSDAQLERWNKFIALFYIFLCLICRAASGYAGWPREWSISNAVRTQRDDQEFGIAIVDHSHSAVSNSSEEPQATTRRNQRNIQPICRWLSDYSNLRVDALDATCQITVAADVIQIQ